ncbi:MAG: HAMP domain-containing histidine kinase, partial [Proteobacteria bacterium]
MPLRSFPRELALHGAWAIGLLGALVWLASSAEENGSAAHRKAAAARATSACAEIQTKLARGRQALAFRPGRDVEYLGALLQVVLERYSGLEGGAWSEGAGLSGYAFPTYEGYGIKRDIPDAEKSAITKIAVETKAKGEAITQAAEGQRETLILTSCPPAMQIPGESPPIVWILSRTAAGAGLEADALKQKLLRLLLFFVPSALLLMAFSVYRARRRQARELELTATQRRDNRLASLGRIAAGVAHEIRNPVATLRLKLENTAHSPAERMPKSLPVMLEQIARIDRLVQGLLGATQPYQINPESLNVESWLQTRLAEAEPAAAAKGVNLDLTCEPDLHARFDPFQLGRAVENLLANAIAFSPAQESVRVRAYAEGKAFRIEIADAGPGLS